MTGIFKINNNEIIDSSGKLTSAVFPSGIIKNATVFTNNNRTTVNTSTSTDREVLHLGDYNKLSSSTKLLISVFCPIHGADHSGVRAIGIKYGAAGSVWGGSYYYGSSFGGFFEAHCYLPSHSTTGSQTVSLREGTANGTDNGKAFNVINPNGSQDEARYHQTISTVRIYEII